MNIIHLPNCNHSIKQFALGVCRMSVVITKIKQILKHPEAYVHTAQILKVQGQINTIIQLLEVLKIFGISLGNYFENPFYQYFLN